MKKRKPSPLREAAWRIGAALLLVLALYVGIVAFKIYISGLLAEKGRVRVNVDNLYEAEAFSRKAVRLNPDNSYAWYYLSGFYMNQKRYEDAYESIAPSLKNIPHLAKALKQAARISAVLGRLDESLYYYHHMFLMEPRPKPVPHAAWFNYGVLAQRANAYGVAVSAFLSSITSSIEEGDPRWSEGKAYTNLSKAYMSLHNPGMAYYAASTRYLTYPENLTALREFLVTTMASRRYREASALLENHPPPETLDPQTATLAGAVYYYAGEYARAKSMLVPVIEAAPDKADPRVLLADTCMELEEFAAAASQYREVLRIAPNHPRKQEIMDKIEKAEAR